MAAKNNEMAQKDAYFSTKNNEMAQKDAYFSILRFF